MSAVHPYRSTPIFDEKTLPAALRARHSTKAGVWGVISVTAGQVRLSFFDPVSDLILDADHPGVVQPEQPHFVTPLGPMMMQIDFYDRPPDGS
jgi:tellurite resistance-related uncharacterized protein